MEENNKVQNNSLSLKEASGNPAGKLPSACFEWMESIVQVVIVVVAVMTFVFRIVNVSGWSMLNTLRDGDKVVVMKWRYKPSDGDVVVIRRGQYLNQPIVKRVIAMEGQSLSIDFSTGKVTVDGNVLNETYIREPMWLEGDGNIPDKVPEGYSFVMGDNRNHSTDSRFKEVGLIDNKNIIGKVSAILYPFNRIGMIN